MSFFISNRGDNRCPGPITGNALNGLCERVCIQTNKVFDSCLKQLQQTDLSVTLTNNVPADYTEPLTFVSGASTVNGTTTITNLTVDRFEERPNFARVSGNVNAPVTINYTDANNIAGSGTGTIVIPFDVIMFVPQPSIIPYSIEAFANIVLPDGTYSGNNVFVVDACLTIILRVIVAAEILVPSYGYCPIPPCQEFTQDVCTGFFDLPLYPTNSTRT